MPLMLAWCQFFHFKFSAAPLTKYGFVYLFIGGCGVWPLPGTSKLQALNSCPLYFQFLKVNFSCMFAFENCSVSLFNLVFDHLSLCFLSGVL
jgi:hypothetical protein